MNILIWGCNDFSERLFKVLLGSSVNVISFIDDNQSPTFCGKPVHHPSVLQTTSSLDEIPVVIATPHLVKNNIPIIDFESIRQFKIKIQEIIATYKINNILLHPSALVDILDTPYHDKIVTYGLQGSGNTIYSHIMQRIKQNSGIKTAFLNRINRLFPISNSDDVPTFFEKMCYEYTQIIHQIISDIIYQIGGSRIQGAPWKTSTAHFNCLTDTGEEMSIFSFSTRDHIICSNYSYHQLPTIETLEMLHLRKFNLFFIMRNPLDIIISILNKESALDKKNKKIDQKMFAGLSIWVINTLTKWHPFLEKVKLLRYESLIQDPIDQINNLRSELDMSRRNKIAKKIWDQVSFRRLPGATAENFWQGGSGKWEKYLNKEHMAFLKFHGMEDVLRKYNYLDVLSKFQSYIANISVDFQKEVSNRFLVDYREYPYGFDNDNTLDVSKQLYGDNNYIQLDHVLLGSKNTAFLEKAAKAFDNSYIKMVSLCGAHPDYKIV